MNLTLHIKAYLILGLFFTFSSTNAQNQKLADSLKSIYLNNDFSDSVLYSILESIAALDTNPNDVLIYSNKLIKESKSNFSHLWMHRGYLQKGRAYRLQGKLDSAIAAYFKSAEAAKKASYMAGIGGSLLSIGDVFGDQGDFNTSIKYTNKAITTLRESSDSLTLAAAIMNSGYGYYIIEKYDSALSYYNESARIYELKNYLLGKAYNLGNAGLVYAKTGKNKKAHQQLNKAIEILIELEDSYAITEFQIEIASIMMQKKQHQEAEKYLIEVLAYANKDGLLERVRDASLKLSRVYGNQQSYKKAFSYHKQYVAYRDSISNDDTIRKMADLRTEYEVGQKQAELDLEAAKIEILEDKAFYAQVKLWAISTATIILLGLLALGLKLYRSRMIALKLADSQYQVISDQRAKLNEMNRLKDQFFSIISHDLRGPIGNLMGVTHLIKMNLNEKQYDELYETNDLLVESTEEISVLLDNLLNWAIAQQQQVSYDLKEISAEEICNPSLRILQLTAKKKSITMTKEIRSEIMLQVDLNTTTTAIRNLLSNALKFTNEGGHITLSVSKHENMGIISVKDDGIGIPESQIDTLFTFTGQRKRWGTHGEKGVGLGLNLVQEFVTKNNGSIEVDSVDGEGSEFKVFLPLFDVG